MSPDTQKYKYCHYFLTNKIVSSLLPPERIIQPYLIFLKKILGEGLGLNWAKKILHNGTLWKTFSINHLSKIEYNSTLKLNIANLCSI